MRLPAAAVTAATLISLAVASLAAPTPAFGARLVGGSQQAAIRRAFDASAAHRGRAIVSIETSSVSPAWAVVRSVAPQGAGRTGAHVARLTLSDSYYRRVGGAERPGSPPAAVRADLDRGLQVAVVFAGSGGESITYNQSYRSACAGQGGFDDLESVTVSPMSWSVRYVVDLGDILSAARSASGTVIVPAISFEASASRVDAVEHLSRTLQDMGCNDNATTFNCTETFHPGGGDPVGDLTLSTVTGLDVTVPSRTTTAGACDPTDYTLGPSLWDGGGATAVASELGLVGGSLPADPYAPVKVAWPGDSGPQSQPFASSPCQGDATVCQDTFHWSGTVALKPVSGA
jgi:hypothetical protein